MPPRASTWSTLTPRADCPLPPHKGRRLPQPTSPQHLHLHLHLHAILSRCVTEEAPDLRRAVCLAGYAGLVYAATAYSDPDLIAEAAVR